MDEQMIKANCRICLLTEPIRQCQLCSFLNDETMSKFVVTFSSPFSFDSGLVQSETIEAKNEDDARSVYKEYEVLDVAPAPAANRTLAKTINTVDVSSNFNGITATATTTWAERHLNNGG